MLIKEAALGDTVYLPIDQDGRLIERISEASGSVSATLLRNTGLPIVGWKDNKTLSSMNWPLTESETYDPEYTYGIYINSIQECLVSPTIGKSLQKITLSEADEIVKTMVSKMRKGEMLVFDPLLRKTITKNIVSRQSFGFLFTCIGIGAGVSNVTKNLNVISNHKEKSLIARK